MNFDQGELDFSATASEEGHRKWVREMEEKKRAFELRHGVIIGRRVRVQLSGELKPMDGMIHLIPQKDPSAATKLRLAMGGREFLIGEVESIILLDAAAPG